jgi:hypothetical protein
VGNSDIDVHIANVMLREMVPDTRTEMETDAEGLTIMTVYPAPARESVNIGYRLGEPASVRISIHDVLGRQVATSDEGWQQAGEHAYTLETALVSAGVYAYRIEARTPRGTSTSDSATFVVVK